MARKDVYEKLQKSACFALAYSSKETTCTQCEARKLCSKFSECLEKFLDSHVESKATVEEQSYSQQYNELNFLKEVMLKNTKAITDNLSDKEVISVFGLTTEEFQSAFKWVDDLAIEDKKAYLEDFGMSFDDLVIKKMEDSLGAETVSDDKKPKNEKKVKEEKVVTTEEVKEKKPKKEKKAKAKVEKVYSPDMPDLTKIKTVDELQALVLQRNGDVAEFDKYTDDRIKMMRMKMFIKSTYEVK